MQEKVFDKNLSPYCYVVWIHMRKRVGIYSNCGIAMNMRKENQAL